ncbi:MAG: exodeoxyribonuclease III [Acidimicrobiales bacterium]
MRLATWNVNSLKARLGRVEEWLAYAQPDVVCLQETKLADAAFPALGFQALGYESAHHGDGRWNGVAILSRVGLESVTPGFGNDAAALGATLADEVAAERRLLTATCGGVRISSVYVPNGRSLDSDQFPAKLDWLARLRRFLATTSSPDEPIAVCGDFNIAPDDRDVFDPARFTASTHTSAAERAALAALGSWGLVDAFRLLYDQDRLYTWWDYRAGDFHSHRGMRIDLVMVSAPLARAVRWAIVDRNARKGKLPSDHAPVIVDLDDAALTA